MDNIWKQLLAKAVPTITHFLKGHVHVRMSETHVDVKDVPGPDHPARMIPVVIR